MESVHVSIHDRRIDGAEFKGFYSATFEVEYKWDYSTSITPDSVIICRTYLRSVDFSDDKTDDFVTYRCHDDMESEVPAEIVTHVFAETDFELIKERAIEKIGEQCSRRNRELI